MQGSTSAPRPAARPPAALRSQAARQSTRATRATLRSAPTWALGAALAAVLAGLYLLLAPPSADLAAATYRSDLFASAGFIVWDDGWYAGHALPAYSLLAPALGAWLGVRMLLALSAIAASALFGAIAARTLREGAALAATLAFAFGFCAELPSGRVPYDLGVACALAATMAIASAMRGTGPPQAAGAVVTGAFTGRRRRAAAFALAIALSVLSSAASPVAGAFLALAALALALGARSARWLAVCAAALLPILALALAFPEGGLEPFAAGAFWPELAAAIAFASLLPKAGLDAQARRTLRIAACLYALALAAGFFVNTPMGGNVVRLGALLGAPLVVGALWEATGVPIGGRVIGGRAALLALAPLLLYWQLATAIDDQVSLAGDLTVHASFYAPLRSELLRLAGGAGGAGGANGAGGVSGVGGHPIRVEVPLTGAHWESAYLPGGPISIARGWERQLDTRYGALFYGQSLAAAAYRSWLSANAIAYVALPRARLDSAGQQERRLILSGLPYLRQVWQSAHWRLFAVLDATPLAQAPARMLQIGPDSFALQAPRAGGYEVRLHWTPYWSLRSGRGCVTKAPDGFTEVRALGAGRIEVAIAVSLPRIFAEGALCED